MEGLDETSFGKACQYLDDMLKASGQDFPARVYRDFIENLVGVLYESTGSDANFFRQIQNGELQEIARLVMNRQEDPDFRFDSVYSRETFPLGDDL